MKTNYILSFVIITFLFQNLNAQLPTPNNYIIFVDFSARIEVENQKEKDIKLVSHIIDIFDERVKSLYKSGKIFSEDKISILFYPDLDNEGIIELTSSLSIDFSNVNFQNKLNYYKDNFPQNNDSKLLTNFKKIYDIALMQKPNYFGSNIYDFFNSSIKNYLKKDYKNKIFVLTDGYMYMAGENPDKIENKLGHLEGSILDPLRSSSDWERLYNDQNWGLRSANIKLPSNTTVCLIELNPNCINNLNYPRTKLRPLKPCPNEFNILKRIWSDWFLDMGLNNKNLSIDKTENNLTGIKNKITKFSEK